MPPVAAPGVDEIRLHTARPHSGLTRFLDSIGGDDRPPYWAWPWGGGLALARYLLDRPESVGGRRVLDLGCGGGLVAIAAKTAGAASVVAMDVDPLAATAVGLNAALNGVEVIARTDDPLDGPPPEDIDLILAGDVFYAAHAAARALPFLSRCRDAGIDVLIGDPGRATLPSGALRRLATVEAADFGGPAADGAVYALA